ncbi:excinuclease ABC subunit UvrC [bacterium]|nr:excinuclease ABC subunit UvrC [bacterium]
MKRSKENKKNIPNSPGVYLLYNEHDEIIYIGKAKNLHNRLAGYFNKNSDTHKTKLLKKTFKFYDFYLTKSEIEALLLENTLIKKYKPKFNIMLKDDKTYPFLAFNKNHDFPYLYFTRVKKLKKNTIYFGPYTNSHGLKIFLEYLLERFKLRKCRGKLPAKSCIYYSIGTCSAPCIEKISQEDYVKDFNNAIGLINSKRSHLLKGVENSMKEASNDLNFEKAARFRDILNFLQNSRGEQNVVNKRGTFDVISFVHKDNLLLIGIAHYFKGTLQGIHTQEYFHFDLENIDEIYNFLSRYYLQNFVPNNLFINEDISIVKLQKVIDEAAINIKIKRPGKKHNKYIDLINRNLEFRLSEIIEIKEKINFKVFFPEYGDITIVDAFDISHISGTFTIGGVVRFKSNEPQRSMFRNYLLPNDLGNPNDFLSIYLSVKKHIEHLKKHNFRLPHMLLIDGGKGQLSSAKKALDDIKMNIPIMSIAKGKNEKIFLVNKKEPLIFSPTNPLLQYIVKIRNAVHDHSIKKHRKKREKIIMDFLKAVPGIGNKKAKLLLDNYKMLSNMQKTANDELLKIITETSLKELRKKLKEFLK